MRSEVAQDLRAAADVLERDGWTQQMFCDPSTGARCVMGSLDAVYGPRDSRGVGDPNEAIAYIRLTEVIGPRVIQWNDAPGRTADEVIAALRAAADRAEVEQ